MPMRRGWGGGESENGKFWTAYEGEISGDDEYKRSANGFN